MKVTFPSPEESQSLNMKSTVSSFYLVFMNLSNPTFISDFVIHPSLSASKRSYICFSVRPAFSMFSYNLKSSCSSTVLILTPPLLSFLRNSLYSIESLQSMSMNLKITSNSLYLKSILRNSLSAWCNFTLVTGPFLSPSISWKNFKGVCLVSLNALIILLKHS